MHILDINTQFVLFIKYFFLESRHEEINGGPRECASIICPVETGYPSTWLSTNNRYRWQRSRYSSVSHVKRTRTLHIFRHSRPYRRNECQIDFPRLCKIQASYRLIGIAWSHPTMKVETSRKHGKYRATRFRAVWPADKVYISWGGGARKERRTVILRLIVKPRMHFISLTTRVISAQAIDGVKYERSMCFHVCEALQIYSLPSPRLWE